MTPLPSEAEHCLVEKWLQESLHEWYNMWLQLVMVPRINTRGGRVMYAMAPHTITPAVGALCRCKAKAGLRR
ncbi:hypothetical protein TNCV_3649701 [Trichonephila clavipes]|nr:hypothetical protein TNCV_3649701 [Trichonephila clavipes]